FVLVVVRLALFLLRRHQVAKRPRPLLIAFQDRERITILAAIRRDESTSIRADGEPEGSRPRHVDMAHWSYDASARQDCRGARTSDGRSRSGRSSILRSVERQTQEQA